MWFSAGTASFGRIGTLGGSGRTLEQGPHLAAQLCHLVLLVLRPASSRLCEQGNLEKFTLANLPIMAAKFRDLGLQCARAVDDSPDRMPGDWPLKTSSLPQRISGDGRGDEGRGLLARLLV